MSRIRLVRSICALAALLPLLAGPRGSADDRTPPAKPGPAKPTIEFRTFPGKPEGDTKYKFSLTVEVEGTDAKFESRDNSATGGFTGEALAEFCEAEIKQAPGWKYAVDGRKLVIEGWTDPKTKTFHPVKAIRFESPNLPNDALPTVTMPPKA